MKYVLGLLIFILAACATTGEGVPSSAPPPVPPEDQANAPEPFFGGVDAETRCAGEGYHCVRVIYGTNRDRLKPEEDASGQQAYGTEPEQHDGDPVEPATYLPAYAVPNDIRQLPTTTRLETGEVIVTIPALHRRGDAIRSLSSRRTVSEDQRSRYFSFLAPPEAFADHAAFEARVAELYATTDERDAVLHVHGFNVSFRNGAFRAAQLKSDTGFEGPVFYFSWPSNARLTEYFNDQVDGDMSARALANFMLQIRTEIPEGGTLHVIAHSMGSRVFSQAAALLRDTGSLVPPGGDEPMFGAVILAAGDLDSGLASEWLGDPDTLAQSVTFLTSRNDRAVAFSGILRNFFLRSERRRKTRIGFFKPARGPVIFPGVNVFDITFLKTGFWERFASTNHSTYAEDDFSLRYISRLLEAPTSSPQDLAEGNTSLAQCQGVRTPQQLGYWVLGALRGKKVCSRPYDPVAEGRLVAAD